MAHIRKKILADGSKAYQVRWNDPAGGEPSKQFGRWEDARDFKITIEGELQRGTYVDPKAGKTLFRKYFTEVYVPGLQQRSQSVERLESIFKLHVLPVLGDMRIGAIRRLQVQRLVNELVVKKNQAPRGPAAFEPTLAASYVVHIYELVSSVFNAAVVDNVIPKSPCVKINTPEVHKKEIIIPTTDQVLEIARRISPRYKNMLIVAAGTGMRSGELRGLSKDNVDWLRKKIKVRQQMITPTTGSTYLGPPKTRAGTRDIPVADVVIEALSDQINRYGTGEGGIIFTNRTGKWVRNGTAVEKLRPILDDLGFAPGIAWHLLRHYYASMLIRARLSVKVVQLRLGHASAVETWDTYGHLWPEDEEDSRTAVQDALGGSVTSPSDGSGSVKKPSLGVLKATHVG